MRSFVYLPLISTIVSLAFATETSDEKKPLLDEEKFPEVNMEPALGSGHNSPRGHQEGPFTLGSGQNSPRRHQEDSYTLGSGRNSPERHQDSSTSFMTPLSFGHNPHNVQSPPGSPGPMSKYGYLCQESLYRLNHLRRTANRACKYILNNSQMNGRVKYPMKLNNDNQPNTQYLFPVLPENKIFNGGYFNFGLRLRHFLVIDSDCVRVKVAYRVSKNPRKSTKNWCSWPKCFSKGISQYFNCPAFYQKVDSSQPDYFQFTTY